MSKLSTYLIISSLPLAITSTALAQATKGAIAFGASGVTKSTDPNAPVAPAPHLGAPSEVHGTEADTAELGLFWGAFFPESKHELYEPDTNQPSLGHHQLENVTPEIGFRGAYFPWRVLGLEAEAALLPSQTTDTGAGLNLWTLRAHAMLLAPVDCIVPFLLVGGGVLGVSSDPAVLGSDSDPVVHFGIGVKAYVQTNVALRLDLRDTIAPGFGKDETAMMWEALLGFSLVVGRAEPPPPPPPAPIDSDGDGITDDRDMCSAQPGVEPEGCPPPDADADGIADASDACPTAEGPTSTDPATHGCPPPPPDSDGDGVPDVTDACPAEAGDAANGCIADTDTDGLRDRDDKCPNEAESKNGFEDQDGCPDDLPEAVKLLTGVIEGVVFDTNKATLRKVSFAKLDEAVKVLTDFPALRMEVSSHSEDSGKAERDTQLSKERAEAVKAYFVSKGVATERIEAVGAGSTMPIADNTTKEGRTKNRRIELKILP